jgi:hypothetical protein
MDDSVKTAVDIAATGLTVSAVMDLVPEITALFTLIWVLLRIWETETVKILTGRKDIL